MPEPEFELPFNQMQTGYIVLFEYMTYAIEAGFTREEAFVLVKQFHELQLSMAFAAMASGASPDE